MKFQHYDLGQRNGGDVVVVTLKGSEANVCLMDDSNFNAYKNGRQYSSIGGLAKRSPVRLTIPSNGRWNVTVDLRGLSGSTQSSIKIIPNPLPKR